MRFLALYWGYREYDESDEVVDLSVRNSRTPIEDLKNHKSCIHVTGLNERDESVHVKIFGFKPWFYACKSRGKIDFYGLNNALAPYPETVCKQCKMKRIYGGTEADCVKISCRSQSILRFIAGHLERKFKLEVNDHSIDPLVKFIASKNLEAGGWIECNASSCEKFSNSDHCFIVDESKIRPCTENMDSVTVHPSFMSFDIECYSDNHKSKIPDPSESKNVVFQIACTVGRVGIPELRKILLSLGHPRFIDDCDLRVYSTEKQLLLAFSDLIKNENPEIFIGFNIVKFDWVYLIERAKLLCIYDAFRDFDRTKHELTVITKSDWESKAYGRQVSYYIDSIGRVNLDVFIQVERNWKLEKYSLNNVARNFLDEEKVDVSPRQLFALYKVQHDMQHSADLEEIKKFAKDTITAQICNDGNSIVNSVRSGILDSQTVDEVKTALCRCMELLGEYCVQDTVLPIRLFYKLELLTSMQQYSSISCVPMSWIHSRGTQVKTLALLYKLANKRGFMIPRKFSSESGDDERYQGAVVVEAHKGIYENVAVLDFASLYPTTMITNNICYSTHTENPENADAYNLLEWEDHVGCEHDPLKRKKSKDKILCKNHRYFFKRAGIADDGSPTDEGLMVMLEKTLLANRKSVKREMFKVDAILKMDSGQASEADCAFYKKIGFETVEKGSLDEERRKNLGVLRRVLDAKQLAIKIAANSAYGFMGATRGYLPFQPGAASVTAMGRKYLMMSIKYLKENYASEGVRVVYGDTDSCMITFEGKSPRETVQLAKRAGAGITHHIKCGTLGVEDEFILSNGTKLRDASSAEELTPEEKELFYQYKRIPLDLEYELMYGTFILLTKKRYIGTIVNEDGVKTGMVKKGIVLTRRDNCAYMKDLYTHVLNCILARKDCDEILSEFSELISDMFRHRVADEKFIIYVGIKSVEEYAKKRKAAAVASKENPFVGRNGREFYEQNISPLDNRLFYSAKVQSAVALRMLARGEVIPANTRLEYLCLNLDRPCKPSENAEDYLYYRDVLRPLGIKIDYIEYMRKFAKPLNELLGILFPRLSEIGRADVEKELVEKVTAAKNATTGIDHALFAHFLQYKNANSIARSILRSVKRRYCKSAYKSKPRLIDYKKDEILHFNTLDPLVETEIVTLARRVVAKNILKIRKKMRRLKNDGIVHDLLRYRINYAAVVNEIRLKNSAVEIEKEKKEKKEKKKTVKRRRR